MESLLVIDLSGERPEARVLNPNSKLPEIVHSFSGEHLKIDLQTLLVSAEAVDEESESGELLRREFRNSLSMLFGKFEQQGIQLPELSMLILPSDELSCCSLEFPFASKKQVEGVLSYELQDYVPFNLERFHYSLALHPELSEDPTATPATVFLYPKLLLDLVIEELQRFNVKPQIALPSTSLIEGLRFIRKDFETTDGLLFHATKSKIHCITLRAGQVQDSKAVHYDSESNGLPAHAQQLLALFARNKLDSLSEDAFLLKTDSKLPLQGIEVRLEREIEMPEERIPEFSGKTAGERKSLLAALLMKKGDWSSISGNLLTRDYSPALPWRRLFQSSKELQPPLMFFCFALALFVLFQVFQASFELGRLEDALRAELISVLEVPEAAASGRETEMLLRALRTRTGALETGISTLSPTTGVKPLRLLGQVSKMLQEGGLSTIKVTFFEQNGPKLELRGEADSYGAVERFEARLRRHELVCSIRRKEAGRGRVSSKRKSFTFEIEVQNDDCE